MISSRRRPSKLGTASLIRTRRASVPSVASTTVAITISKNDPRNAAGPPSDEQHRDHPGEDQSQPCVGVDAPTLDPSEQPGARRSRFGFATFRRLRTCNLTIEASWGTTRQDER